ncbi:hypothetical protein M1M38_gp004 [Halorubrum tailed virus 27]|uniref:Uncharacterized protein n=1 Tax=Halorubrum tailed virus 27 TaxID=2878008 RepID=A0AAE8XXX1_9CAUD|nr:hypothetical protein M1M38_gp004 [Halorubrum tailed virus 27]UBF22697.1 hypothetical protein HRTV-27_gp4 [Halorubrum tailed virus 27]
MLQDFSAGYFLLNADIFCVSFERPSMYVDEVYKLRARTGVDKVLGKLGGRHFEIRPTGSIPDGALGLPASVFEAVDADEGPGPVLIAKESTHSSLDDSGVLP